MKPIDTPAFRRWFGDSKVVDKNGEPLVVYHGTGDEFFVFEQQKSGKKDPGWLGEGFYFTTDPYLAKSYSRLKSGAHKKVMSVYLRIEKPFEATSELKQKIRQRLEVDPEYARKFTESLRAEGYDGVTMPYPNEGYEIVVFDPTQIKSATDNNGDFDPTNPDVRKNPSKMITIEELVTLPVGAVVATPDGILLFRRIGLSKVDWEKVCPSGRGLFQSLEPQEKGSRIFVLMTHLLNREGLVRVEMRENPARAARSYQAREMVPVRYGDDVEMVEQAVWKSDPAYLTEGHFDLEEVKDATRIAEEVFAFQEGHKRRGDVRVTLLGQGNFGRVYKAEMPAGALSVKLPAPTDVHGTRWTRAKIRPLFIHEAGIANELSDKGFDIVPRSIYVELYDGTPAIVREYGEPIHSLSPDEFYEIELKLVDVESNGFRVQDDVHLYRRQDGTLYVGDVGIWQPEGRRLKPHKKGWMDTSLPGLLSLLARDTLGIQTTSYSSLPGLILTANLLQEAVDEYDPEDKSVFLKMSLEDALRSIGKRQSLHLPVPPAILCLVEQAQRLIP